MRKKYLIVASLLLASLAGRPALAQASFRPGYIVRPAGDTLRGEVQQAGELSNTFACRFRATPLAADTRYPPAELRAYGFAGGAQYETHPVPAADSSARAAPELLFLELLVGGRARLYSCRDKSRTTRLFVAVGPASAPLQLLEQRRVKTFVNSSEAYETQARYRSVLAAALTNCPVVQAQLPQLPFQQAALARVIARYNECVGEAAVRQPRPTQEKPGPVLSVLAGYQHGTLRLSGESFFNAAPALSQATATAGLGLVMPRTRRTITFRLEASYAHELYEGSYTGLVPTAATPTTQLNTYRFDMHYMHVPILLRYTLMSSPRLRPFVEAGGHYARLLSAQTAFTQGIGTIATFSIPYFMGDDVRYNQFGLAGGVGVSAPLLGERRLAVLARVATSGGPSYYATISSPTTYYSLLLSLDVTKQ